MGLDEVLEDVVGESGVENWPAVDKEKSKETQA